VRRAPRPRRRRDGAAGGRRPPDRAQTHNGPIMRPRPRPPPPPWGSRPLHNRVMQTWAAGPVRDRCARWPRPSAPRGLPHATTTTTATTYSRRCGPMARCPHSRARGGASILFRGARGARPHTSARLPLKKTHLSEIAQTTTNNGERERLREKTTTTSLITIVDERLKGSVYAGRPHRPRRRAQPVWLRGR
jgi:hypothetical protein